MHSASVKLGSFLIAVLIAAAGASDVFSKDADWKKFSAGIRMALVSPNTGVQQSALRMIIKYGQYLEVDESIPDMIHIYRVQKNEHFRRLVLLAIYQIDQQEAFNLVEEQFESDSRAKRSEFVKMYSR